MSLMEKIFGVKTAPAPAPAPNSGVNNNLQGNPPGTQQTQQTSPNGVIPEGGNKPEDKGEQSPLKSFENLWQPKDPDKNDTTPPENQFTTEKFMEAAGKVDFTKVLNREDLQKISAGGEEAVNALVAVLNKTSQTVFGQTAALAHKLSERSAQTAREEVLSQIPALLKKHNANESLLQANPAFSNPALQPVVSALQSQFAEKYPNASSKEIEKMTLEYLQGAADMINPPKPKKEGQGNKGNKGNESEDWISYLSQ